MFKQVDEEDAKIILEEMVEDCGQNGTRYLITRNGEDVAYLIPFDHYEHLLEIQYELNLLTSQSMKRESDNSGEDMSESVAESMRKPWVEWLAQVGYGIDFHYDGTYPPCTLRELAVAYEDHYRDKDLGYGMTVEDWMDTIEAETGPWSEDRRS